MASQSSVKLGERFGISRKQGHKWRNRYEFGGVEALRDRPPPLHHPHAVPDRIVNLIVEARRRHPRWGRESCWSFSSGRTQRSSFLSRAP
jgi:hypothetical protein